MLGHHKYEETFCTCVWREQFTWKETEMSVIHVMYVQSGHNVSIELLFAHVKTSVAQTN